MENISFGDYRRSLGLTRANPKTDKEFAVPDHAERVYDPPWRVGFGRRNKTRIH